MSRSPSWLTRLRLAQRWLPSFLHSARYPALTSRYPNTFIKYAPVGSGEGVRRFIGKDVAERDKVDFGVSDAAMSDAELAQTDNNTLMLPVTAGCVGLAYNLPGFHGDLKLSRQAYAGIFLGDVTNWNDPIIARSNPDVKLPDLTIAPVVGLDSSGTTFAFTGNLAAINR